MCVFCNITQGIWSSKKVYEDDDILAILDLSQQTKGHTLIMPKKHYDNLLDMPKDLLEKIIKKAQELALIYKDKLGADGFNLVNNCNEVAGQSVMHFHLHLIPRYKDDKSKLIFINNYDGSVSDANNEGKYDLDEILNEINK